MQEFFQSLSERLHSSAHVKTIYGEPFVMEGKTIIPVAKIAYGWGGGFGSKKASEDKVSQPEAEGGGGGLGLGATPVGVVEITSGNTRFIEFGSKKKLAAALLVGVVFGIWMGKRRSHEK
jgi:uncharacterized spore protein YtfJ